jgi:chloramphenicol 3-O phosphotransferase
MIKGQIIFLNGTSSSGKSTLAATLQKTLDKPYLYMSIDRYLHQFEKSFSGYQKLDQSAVPTRSVINHPWLLTSPEPSGIFFFSVVSRFHQAIAEAAHSGNRVIVDHVLDQKVWLKECVTLLNSFEVIFVGLHCPLEELERREISRGDRKRGLARHQYQRVHTSSIYDIELDTSTLTPDACAAIVVEYINSDRSPTAFKQLMQNFRS